MTKQPDPKTADRVEYVTADEMAARGGMLGRLASALIRHQGWYSYTEHPSGRKVLLIAR
jgi:hypothetical protein